MPKSVVSEMIVTHFYHQRRSKWLPFGSTFRAPTARPGGGVSGETWRLDQRLQFARREQDSDNGFPSQENFRRCQSLFRCTNEMMKSARNSRKQILASQASVPASTVKPSAAATIAISKKINA